MEIAAASFPGIDLMGMCSRQERIQKDIDVVIQKSRAEKDCSFAGEFSFPSLRPAPASPARPPPPFPVFRPRRVELGVGGGLHVPVPGFIWQQLLQQRAGTKRRRGRQPPPFSPPPLDWGRHRLGGQNPCGRSWALGKGALRCIFSSPRTPRASKPASGVSAAATREGG